MFRGKEGVIFTFYKKNKLAYVGSLANWCTHQTLSDVQSMTHLVECLKCMDTWDIQQIKQHCLRLEPSWWRSYTKRTTNSKTTRRQRHETRFYKTNNALHSDWSSVAHNSIWSHFTTQLKLDTQAPTVAPNWLQVQGYNRSIPVYSLTYIWSSSIPRSE